MSKRTLVAERMGDVIDWSGQIISKQAIKLLSVGCVVRVNITNLKSGVGEAIYFTITKIKDGTFWGKARDTYRLDDYVGLDTDEQFTFRAHQISEIPIEWQPARFQRKASRILDTGKGYAFTGWR